MDRISEIGDSGVLATDFKSKTCNISLTCMCVCVYTCTCVFYEGRFSHFKKVSFYFFADLKNRKIAGY